MMGEPPADDKGRAGSSEFAPFGRETRIVDKRRLNCYKGKIFCYTGSLQP